MSEAVTTLDEAKRVLADIYRHVTSSARLTRKETMDMLQRIYAIRLSPEDRQMLLDHIIEVRKLEGANRAYLMKANNPFVLPLRYVFPSKNDRTNVSRYAGALRELWALKTPTTDFAKAVVDNGGLVELYWQSRQRLTKKMTRNKITLDRNITVEAGRPITLHLLPTASGIFKVLSDTKSEQAIG